MSELRRRLVHASGTVLPLSYALGVVTWRELGFLFLLVAAGAALLEFVRLVLGYEWPIFDRLARDYEADNVAGYALYAFSLTAVAWLFPPAAGMPAMLMLTVGDPISGLLGSADVGEVKSLSTLAVMFAVCAALAWPFVEPAAASAFEAVAAVAVGAAGATVADGVKPVVAGYVIDDNASIPPTAAVGIHAVLWLL